MKGQLLRFPNGMPLDTTPSHEPSIPSNETYPGGITEGKWIEKSTGSTTRSGGQFSPSVKLISVDELYLGEAGLTSIYLRNALQGIEAALKLLDQALLADRDNDPVKADDAMMHFAALLPQLFLSRPLGDGFGMLVNAIATAIRNQQGIPLDAHQMTAVRTSMKTLRSMPFLSAEKAIEQVILLEEVGMNPEDARLDRIADIPAQD